MKTGEQECGERLQVAELLVHHNTLNSNTLTHQLGGGKGGMKGSRNGVEAQNHLVVTASSWTRKRNLSGQRLCGFCV